jgi:hypothetical protein
MTFDVFIGHDTMMLMMLMASRVAPCWRDDASACNIILMMKTWTDDNTALRKKLVFVSLRQDLA